MKVKLSAPRLAVVIPCYNEQEALPLTVPVVLGQLDLMADEGLVLPDSYVLCSNDGSRDDTWKLIQEMHLRDRRVKGISLAHNRGHQYALLAGLMTAMDNCDVCISIDADMQDNPEAMAEMVRKYRGGKEIVYGVRSSRSSDSFFKRTTAHVFYSFQNAMGLETVYDHADYRLLSNRALHLLSEYGESNMYLRGIVPQLGLDTDKVFYERSARVAGESKYPLSKMLALTIDGITSFSARPMRWIFITGIIILAVTVIVAVYVLVSYFVRPDVNPGWASIMLSIWGLGALLLVAIGIAGEYIGKIFNEVKGRPRYALRDKLWD